MKFNKLLIFIVLTLFLLQVSKFSLAANETSLYPFPYFEVNKTGIVTDFFPDEQGKYVLTIINKGNVVDKYRIYSDDQRWIVSIIPNTFILAPGEEKNVTLILVPRIGNYKYGGNLIPIFISGEKAGVKKVSIYAYLKDYALAPGQYVASVAFNIDPAQEELDPREQLQFDVYMRNRNALNITSMDLVVESPLFSNTFQVSLGPLEEKSQRIYFEVDPKTRAGVYSLTARLIYDGKKIAEVSKDFKIKAYEDLKKEEVDKKGFFVFTKEIRLKNEGNDVYTYNIPMTVKFYEALFTKTNPPLEKINVDGKVVKGWAVTLQPGEEIVLVKRSDYRLLVFIIVVIILGILAYYIFRSPIVVVKEAKVLVADEEGISKMKILIHIRNRTGKTIKDVKVVDVLPKIVEPAPHETVLGTISPSSVKKRRDYTAVLWHIERLDPYEERLISYNVYTKLKVVGPIALPSTEVIFKTEDGKERSVLSNMVSVEE